MVVSGMVPTYDLYGHQHHRTPYQDKSMFNSVKPIGRWTHKPRVKTRTELIQVRSAQKIPHISYDLNGDGVVDHKDYFFARHFDEGGKGRLTEEEQKTAQNALSNGFADRFLLGLEKQGAKRPFAIFQKRGKVMTQDLAYLFRDTYPPHFNCSNTAAHNTLTDCKQDRLRERAEGARALKEKWDAENPSRIEEPPVPREGWVEHPPIQHIKERADGDYEHQRIKSGLYPCSTAINPEREHLVNGLGYEENPEFHTRSQLLATRKELMIQDLNEQRTRGEEVALPQSVTRGEREARNHEFRRREPNTMTQSQMNLSRKCERIEYDRTHFGEKLRELPRFSDQAHPWWTLTRCSSAPAGSKRPEPVKLQPRPVHPKSAPAMRKEEPPVCVPTEEHQIMGSMMQSRILGEKTTKRMSADQLERGSGPRFFDSLPAAKSLPQDHVDLDEQSSFQFIRSRALRETASSKARNAMRTKILGGPKSVLADEKERSGTPSRASGSRLQTPISAATHRVPGGSYSGTPSMYSRTVFIQDAHDQGAPSTSSYAKSKPYRSASASVMGRGGSGARRPGCQKSEKSYGKIEVVEMKDEGTMLDRFGGGRPKNGARPTTAPSHMKSAPTLPTPYGIRTAW